MTEKKGRGVIAEIKNCMYDGATMIKLHMSGLDNTSVPALLFSRIANALFGGLIAFCVARCHAGSMIEQIDLKTIQTIVDNMKKFI